MPGAPQNTLNFVGDGVTVTDAGGGVATVNIPGTNVAHDETLVGSGTPGDPLGVNTGPAYGLGPTIVGILQPPFQPPPHVVTIYARTTGSDATGDGTTIPTAYRTFQRAIRDVPHVIPPATQYVVDITGITEVLPAGYQLLPINSGARQVPPTPPLPFRFGVPLTIRATPQPASTIPLADTTILPGYTVTAEPGSGLATINVVPPRPSWAGDSLKGKFLTGSVSALTGSAIYGSNANQIFVANNVASIPLAQTLSIVEPSAHLDAVDTFRIVGCNSINLQGLRLTTQNPSTAAFIAALEITECSQPITELCDIDGLFATMVGLQVLNSASVLRQHAVNFEGASWTPDRCLVLGIPATSFVFGHFQGFRRTVFDGILASLTDPPVFLANTFGGILSGGWEFLTCLFKNGVAPNGALFARGGSWNLQDVVINGYSADAIRVQGAVQLAMTNVTGAGNGGFGVRVNDGGYVRVTSDATLVMGALGDMKVGTRPVRTWADFRAVAPIKNEYDTVSPAVGDEVTGAGTGGTSGSRLYQRP